MEQVVQALAEATAAFYRSRGPGAQVPAEVLDALAAAPVVDSLTNDVGADDDNPVVPLTQRLCAVGDDPEAAHLVAALAAAAPALRWAQTPAYVEALGPRAANGYGYVRLVGPSTADGAAIEHPSVVVGLGVWAAGLTYPMHRHAAAEIYHVAAGEPRFRRAGEDWHKIGTRGASINGSNVAHEQDFGDQPCLLLWAWTGDTSAGSELVA